MQNLCLVHTSDYRFQEADAGNVPSGFKGNAVLDRRKVCTQRPSSKKLHVSYLSFSCMQILISEHKLEHNVMFYIV